MSANRLLPRTAPKVVVALILLFLAFPIVVVVVVSFSSATYLTFPPPAFGLRWYSAYFGSADWLSPLIARYSWRGQDERHARLLDRASELGVAAHSQDDRVRYLAGAP